MLHNIDPKQIAKNPFSMIGDQWMLITAGDAESCNTMTASWGGLGILWNKPMAIAYIRPQRYTKQFVDEQEYFTLTFFPAEYRQALALCGTKSGRDTDKVKECGFTVAEAEGGAPYFEQAELVLVCRKLYQSTLKEEGFVDRSILADHYPSRDLHEMYIGEIVKVLVAD